MVTGAVGSGKSTLIAGLLGVTPQTSGKVSRSSPTVSYCPQNPWIMSGSVRDNVVCGREFDPVWFEETIRVCALAADLKGWDRGDLHEAGNDGGNLSGGQRQRVVRVSSPRTLLMMASDMAHRHWQGQSTLGTR